MMLSINPKTFMLHDADRATVESGFKLVKRSACGQWFDVQSDMVMRRRRLPCGELVELNSMHFSAFVEGKGRMVFGPYIAPIERGGFVEAVSGTLSKMGVALELIVFHVDPLEFGTQHNPKDESGNLILSMAGAFL